MSTQSISSRLSDLRRPYRNRQSHRRLGNKRTRRSIAAPESLECRRLLASDFGFGGGDAPGDEPFPDTFTVAGVKWDDVNANGMRDQGEPGLADVTVYSDLNRNGRSEENELTGLAANGVVGIDLDYVDMFEVDAYGNFTLQRSVVSLEDEFKQIFDIWFSY